MNLSDSPLGVKRRLKTVGILEWDDEMKYVIFRFKVECIDAQSNLLTDKVISQNREVRYVLKNENRVDANFNPIQSGGTGEYDYLSNLLGTSTSFYGIINSLAVKLNERGLFN